MQTPIVYISDCIFRQVYNYIMVYIPRTPMGLHILEDLTHKMVDPSLGKKRSVGF